MDAYLGTYPVGTVVPLRVQCRNPATGQAVAPDEAPWVRILSASGAVVELVPGLVVDDRSGAVGLFLGRHALTSYRYATDHHVALYSYRVGGVLCVEQDAFEIVGGGDAGGTIISCYAQHHPEVDYILAQVTSAQLLVGYGPRLF